MCYTQLLSPANQYSSYSAKQRKIPLPEGPLAPVPNKEIKALNESNTLK